ncbi:peptidase domain-containing ABC transporter [Thalassotalea fusca]
MTTTNHSSELLNFSRMKSVPMILQAEVAECGLASLAMISSYFGHVLDLHAIRAKFSANLKGLNLQQLMNYADKLGLASRPLQCPIAEINHLQLPCVLHWDMNHFVVLTKISRGKFHINDPAFGKRVLSQKEFSEHFTGIALELSPTTQFKRKDESCPLKLSQLWGKLTGFKRAFIKLFLLSVIIQIISICTPYYMQWVIDEVLISYDESLLIVLAIGFTCLMLFNCLTTAIRSWLILRVSSLMNMQMGINLLHHLLRLPMSYFEARHTGDIMSRFSSLEKIRERLTTGLVETVVDGVMSLLLFAMMLNYSVKLTLIVVTAISLYFIFRWVLYARFYRNSELAVQASAQEQTNFLENIRAIQTIKLFSNEPQRQSLWQNKYADVINAHIKIGRLEIGFSAINAIIFGLENIAVVYLAALTVISGNLTVGMLIAFMAYKSQLTQRMTNFVNQLIEFRMLKLHLHRISDIALHPQESGREGSTAEESWLGKLELINVCYRYNAEQPYIIKNLTLTINAGESVAITGPSGCGKTTLVKLMLGLLRPTSGQILFDGKDIAQIGLTNYRKLVSAVMQEDSLLSGSILDNISFFNPEVNFEKVVQCAQQANINDEIMQMPMNYQSMVGDMGSTISGGQKQRILLARALYSNPRVIFLDEATSHLDSANEFSVNQQIKRLAITRIVVAHRKETIASVDRVISLDSHNFQTNNE